MKTQHPIANKILTLAFIGAASLVAANTSHAAFTNVPVASAPLTIGAPSGGGPFLLVASLESNFEDPNFPGVAPGRFRSVVLDNGLGGLDFYYQVVNDSTDTIDDIFRVEVAGYGLGEFTVDAAFSSTLPVVNPFSGSITPTQVISGSVTADRVANLPQFVDPANFEFALGDEIEELQISNWLVLRTNQTNYTGVLAGVNGASTGFPSAFAPIPEPSTVLFGLAMVGVCAGGRLRKSFSGRKS